MRSIVDDMKHNYFISALLTVVVGLVLVLWPELTGKILCYILGGAIILMGVIQTIVFLRGERIGLVPKFTAVMGLVLIILGIWVCVRPQIVLSIIPVVIGIMMVVHGIMDLQYTVDIKNTGVQRWWIALIAAILTLAIGVFLILQPFLAFELTMMVIGFGLLYDGISDLILIILANHYQKQSDKRMREFAQSVESIHDEDL